MNIWLGLAFVVGTMFGIVLIGVLRMLSEDTPFIDETREEAGETKQSN